MLSSSPLYRRQMHQILEWEQFWANQTKGAMTIRWPISSLLPREQKFSMIEKECLAIKLGVEAFTVYLLGWKFAIQMHHWVLQWLSNFQTLNGRLMRWSLALQPYLLHEGVSSSFKSSPATHRHVALGWCHFFNMFTWKTALLFLLSGMWTS